MQIILPILAASLLVTAQALWKKSFLGVNVALTKEFLLSKDFFSLFLSKYFIGGALLYLFATLFYIYLFNKYQFHLVQTIMMVSAIIITFSLAKFFFNEELTVLKGFGLLLLIIGVVLIYKK